MMSGGDGESVRLDDLGPDEVTGVNRISDSHGRFLSANRRSTTRRTATRSPYLGGILASESKPIRNPVCVFA